jgi:transcriptional regulator with XRE-family HTH domain
MVMEPAEWSDPVQMVEPTTTGEVADRLRLTREALRLKQAALCRITGISTSAWNNAETGDARIGLDNAILLCQATGVTLDWVFRGIRAGLPHPIAERISELERAAERAMKPSGKSRR